MRSYQGQRKVGLGKGHLAVVTGPMFSGKTTECMRLATQHASIGRKVLVVSHSLDLERNGGLQVIKTHDGKTYKAMMVVKLADIPVETILQHDVIAIDEGQFFADLVSHVISWVTPKNGKDVIVCGLDGTSELKPFCGDLSQLLRFSDSFVKLNALCSVCKDGTFASFSQCLVEKTSDVMAGGGALYRAVCRNCHHLHSHPYSPWDDPFCVVEHSFTTDTNNDSLTENV